MAVKCFQAKLRCTTPPQREALERTHRLFNEHLRPVLKILMAARRGSHGPRYKAILRTVKNAQKAKEQVEAISSLSSQVGRDGKESEWKPIARVLLDEGRILFDREKLLRGFSSEFRRKI